LTRLGTTALVAARGEAASYTDLAAQEQHATWHAVVLCFYSVLGQGIFKPRASSLYQARFEGLLGGSP
jgi:hypothetical protein